MNLSKRTAERMLQNIEKKLQALASEQQAMNGNVGGKKMRKGGRVKMQTKGTVPGGYTYGKSWLDGVSGFGMDKYQVDFGLKPLGIPTFASLSQYGGSGGPTVPTAVSDANLAKANINGLTETRDLPMAPVGYSGQLNQTDNLPGLQKNNNLYTGGQGPASSMGGFGLNDALGLLPTAFNTIAGLTSGKADKLNPNEFQNPYESQAFGMMPSEFRIDPMLTDNRNAYGNYLRNVNQTGNSRGERMANYGAGMNRMNEANTRAWALKNNEEADMATRKAMLRNAQGDRRAGVNLQVRDMNDANSAAARNRRMAYFAAAAEGGQRYGLTQEQMANQQFSQNAYIEALRRQGPYWNQWLGLDEMQRGRRS